MRAHVYNKCYTCIFYKPCFALLPRFLWFLQVLSPELPRHYTYVMLLAPSHHVLVPTQSCPTTLKNLSLDIFFAHRHELSKKLVLCTYVYV